MTNTGKRYDNQFKEDIVRLIRVDKRFVASVVKDFGLSEQTVRTRELGERLFRANVCMIARHPWRAKQIIIV